VPSILRVDVCLLLLLPVCSALQAQTTQGLISGVVRDRRTNAFLPGAKVTYSSASTGQTGSALAADGGQYVLPLLSPGTYQVTVERHGFQPQTIYNLELAVSARLDLDFDLRPDWDLWGSETQKYEYTSSERIVNFYATDAAVLNESRLPLIDPKGTQLYSSVSYVVDSRQIQELPLPGRDVYAVLALEPGVTSDSPTGRGLGLSANGQRPTASNFLLDGLENNNYLLSGPLAPIAPEAIEEYRFSTSGFSAEYGRTAGYFANAVSRSGGAAWHGQAYSYLENQHLDATDFQRNVHGLGRTPLHQLEVGLIAGGPLGKSFFASATLDRLRFRSTGDPENFIIPSASFVSSLTHGSIAASLLARFPPPVVQSAGDTATLSIDPPSSLDRWSSLSRVDRLWPDGTRIMGRVLIVREERPDFTFSPYRDFSSPLDAHAAGLAVTALLAGSRHLISEFRFGWSIDDLRFERANPQIPTLEVEAASGNIWLPGSPQFSPYRNRSRNWEGIANFTRVQRKHVAKAGAGILVRNLDGYLAGYRDGVYDFGTLDNFKDDQPPKLFVGVAQAIDRPTSPNYNRQYRYTQFFGFAQDSWRPLPRLSLDYGFRYENFGVPRNVGPAKDALIEAGELQTPAGGGSQPLYAADNNDWAGRFGFAYNPHERSGTLLRGGYGIFYDRPFDNLWQTIQNNSAQRLTLQAAPNYLSPIADQLAQLPAKPVNGVFPLFERLTLYQHDLRTPYVHRYFLRLERPLTANLYLEVSGLGSLGRKLIATDIINRTFQISFPALPEVSYRSNQGSSNYHALTAMVRRRGGRYQLEAAYTWSHTIDNQSDPLAKEFSDMFFTQPVAGFQNPQVASFTLDGNSRADRGSSDFDQRQSAVFRAIWDLPGLSSHGWTGAVLRNWRVSALAAFRTGFPFTVYGLGPVAPEEYNARAGLAVPGNSWSIHQPYDGGVRLLKMAAFSPYGGLGRNVFTGPGFYNVDLSLGRWFAPRSADRARIAVRADAFNFLNHANLNNPDPSLYSSTFGIAFYGRGAQTLGFPTLVPFTETARQIQLSVRVEF
jgi:hypothetical protein